MTYTDSSTLIVATPLRSASLDMARSALMGVGTPLLARGMVTGQEWQAIVGGLIALASAIWSYLAAHPSKVGALQTVLSQVRLGGRQASWNGDVAVVEGALIPKADAMVDDEIKAKAGIFAGPVEMAANGAVKAAADTTAKSFLLPQP